jgi:hypothetical protein
MIFSNVVPTPDMSSSHAAEQARKSKPCRLEIVCLGWEDAHSSGQISGQTMEFARP